MCVCILSLQSPRGVVQAWPLSVPIVMEVSIGCALALQFLVQLVYFRLGYTLYPFHRGGAESTATSLFQNSCNPSLSALMFLNAFHQSWKV